MRALRDLVDIEKFPAIASFFDNHIQMQFADLRVMLQFPLGNTEYPGLNFAVTSVLLNLISGFSVCLYDSSEDALDGRGDRGERFQGLLRNYYPWEGESVSPDEGSQWLYRVTRNPFVHSLGIQKLSEPVWAGVMKRSLSLFEIDVLETSTERPLLLGEGSTTLVRKQLSNGETGIFLSLPCLYWGVWRMLENLCGDSEQMAKANQLSEKLGFLTINT